MPPPREHGQRCCASSLDWRFDEAQLERIARDLRILAHPIRLQTLQLLALNEGRACVCDLEAAMPVSQPTISHHLKLLREAGLVRAERDGLWVYYFVNRPALEAMKKGLAALLDTLS